MYCKEDPTLHLCAKLNDSKRSSFGAFTLTAISKKRDLDLDSLNHPGPMLSCSDKHTAWMQSMTRILANWLSPTGDLILKIQSWICKPGMDKHLMVRLWWICGCIFDKSSNRGDLSENTHRTNHMTTAANECPSENGHNRQPFGSLNTELNRET